MKRNRKQTQSAPPAPPAQKRVKVSEAMAVAASNAVQRYKAAHGEYNAAAQQAQQHYAKLMEIAQMHDGLFRAIVEDGGATIDDFKHGFELREGYLYAKAAPSEQAQA